MGYKVHSICKG